MIFETLQIIKEQLEAYLVTAGLGKIVILDNIALWQSGSEDATRLEGKVVLTLLKMDEETTLKNAPNYQIRDGKTEYRNPPVNLNLYLLVSANCETYDKSLRSISKTIQFFQGKKVFTSTNTVYNRNNVSFDVLEQFRFVLDLYTPTFDELNNVWGMLGGRQLPSVIYRIQLIQIEQDKIQSAAEVITHIGGELKHKQQ
ncbi:MAG TPA: DUF4255 domain-containing protein [Prolixibacteraceae bacterium]|nr:DUF4255 domain-containing protein [Prolixibacteraceae bacterium]